MLAASRVHDEFIGSSPTSGVVAVGTNGVRGNIRGLSTMSSSAVHAGRKAADMATRIAFDDEFTQALRVRGMTLTELATRARVSVATASSAVHGRPLNVSTATRLARALAAVPVVSELETWARAPATRRREIERPALAAPAPTHCRRSSRRVAEVRAADAFELPLDVA
jgi:transcriptional regulator with XRE-family HTH domain